MPHLTKLIVLECQRGFAVVLHVRSQLNAVLAGCTSPPLTP